MSNAGSRISVLASDAAEEYDAAYAATVAAVAYAIAAREERLSASQESTPYAAADRFARGNKQSSKSARTTKRGESLEKPNFEGRRSSSSRWFTGKEPIDDDYQDEQGTYYIYIYLITGILISNFSFAFCWHHMHGRG